MIKFFRHIRKSLLMENKTSKYFKYAIGEIILVMIGILLALQVNNWNERRKEKSLEKVLLTSIYHSIVDDTTGWNAEITGYDRQLAYSDYIKRKFQDNSPYEKRLDTAFAVISNGYVREADYTAFNSLLNTGIDIVKNDSIKFYLNRYYAHSEHLVEVENYFENSKFYRQHIYPKYFKAYKYAREAIPNDYNVLKTSTDFAVALDYTINDAYFFKDWSVHKKEDALRLIRLLKQDLILKDND